MQAFNPIKFSNDVNTKFLNYQLTAFPLADPDLAEQAKRLLKGGVDFQPLIKGPYVSISRSYKWGRNLKDLAKAGIVHPALPGLSEFPQMFAHQDKTLQEIQKGNHCLISTGTGSGKTEAFLYPILDYCLRLRDEGVPDGIAAIFVYPMNALAIDQLNRLRKLLAGSGISFGLYIGTTAAYEGDIRNIYRMKPGEGKKEYVELTNKFKTRENYYVSPFEERLTEKEIAENPPRILLTNVKQLELLMTRPKDIRIFNNAPLKYLVFDEAHTYSGIAGAEVSCLIRRLRSLCGKNADEVICIGTSATIIEPDLGEDPGKLFAHRFFGIDKEKISLIQEEYEIEEFPKDRYNPLNLKISAIELSDNILKSLEENDTQKIRKCYNDLTGKEIEDENDIFEKLYNELKTNNYIYSLFHHLTKAHSINEAVQRILSSLARKDISSSEQNKAELLCYLALGSAAKRGDNPLLRPKLHYFVKGLEGAVVAFDKPSSNSDYQTKLFLSRQAASESLGYDESAYLPLFVCKTCGQHYFESYNQNLLFNGSNLEGGQAEGNNVIWLSADDVSGNRVILTDRFVSEIDDEDGTISDRLDRNREEIYFCRWCGAIQRIKEDKCSNPKCKRVNTLVKLYIITTDIIGLLSSCPSCRTRGKTFGRNNEPIRPLRAVTVSDVHILSQNMINATKDENQKLIVFADNRQDAAFQSGWMQDHARRYRFRHLVYEYIKKQNKTVSVGDIQNYLYELFLSDKSLGEILAPEVYESYRGGTYDHTFRNHLRYYLTIQILRELGTSFTQKEGMEAWGILKVIYADVNVEKPWIKKWSEILHINVNDLTDGISSILDVYRRNRYLYDDQAPIFSRLWNEGDLEIQQGYLPLITGANNKPIPPKGLVEYPGPDRSIFHAAFRSRRGQTLVENFVNKWSAEQETVEKFLDDLWDFLTNETKILKEVNLVGSQGRVLQSGVYQIDVSKIGLSQNWQLQECNICHRIHERNTPNGACTSMHCRGRIIHKEPSQENYNISLLSSKFSMLKPQEHTAQVPAKVREEIENEFKQTNGKYNTLIATPTLELGVDIGDLDMVLMRNMPPTPSNYWQRAGRAGRRFRLAVIYTYSRRSNHDQFYFSNPETMLEGVIPTPKFNLKNEVMFRKHVHAAILSELWILFLTNKNNENFSKIDIDELKENLSTIFPMFIRNYLFDEEGNYLLNAFNIDFLTRFIKKHTEYFLNKITLIFSKYWPEDDQQIITPERIKKYIIQTGNDLQQIINLLHLRMMWAIKIQQKYIEYQTRRLLKVEEERILQRCKLFLRELNEAKQSNYTLNVLAEEGYLPGYGLYDTGIKAFAHQSFIGGGKNKPDFELSRSPVIAVREFIPGNLLYANNGRFRLVLYRLPALTEKVKTRNLQVNLEKNTITFTTDSKDNIDYSDVNVFNIPAIPISDSDIHYVSRISDEENNRFQLPVKILGKIRGIRRGGKVYSLNGKTVQLLFGQRLFLLNVGPHENLAHNKIGYPVCTVCGAVRSPFSSEAEIEHFNEFHSERCGKNPINVGLTAEDNVDGIFIQGFEDEKYAVNLAESIILGASRKLEMERNDLNVIIYRENDEKYSMFIYDPMPGGSGLLNQIIEHWENVLKESISALDNCPNSCEESCYSCLRTYQNVFIHNSLDRKFASTICKEFSGQLKYEFELPPQEELQDASTENKGTNKGEISLPQILKENGFPEFQTQKRIEIGPPYNSTVPDLYYEDTVREIFLTIYLDGLSKNIHGNEERRRIDIIIRQQLESMGFDVIEIASSDLNDPEALRLSLKRIAAKMRRRDLMGEE